MSKEYMAALLKAAEDAMQSVTIQATAGNMDRMLGALKTIETVRAELAKPEEKPEEEKEEGAGV